MLCRDCRHRSTGCAASAPAFPAIAYLPAFLLAWSMQGPDYAKKELSQREYAKLCLESAKSALASSRHVQRKR